MQHIMSAGAFRRQVAVEEQMIRASMPRTSARDPQQPAVRAARCWSDGRVAVAVPALTFSMREACHAA